MNENESELEEIANPLELLVYKLLDYSKFNIKKELKKQKALKTIEKIQQLQKTSPITKEEVKKQIETNEGIKPITSLNIGTQREFYPRTPAKLVDVSPKLTDEEKKERERLKKSSKAAATAIMLNFDKPKSNLSNISTPRGVDKELYKISQEVSNVLNDIIITIIDNAKLEEQTENLTPDTAVKIMEQVKDANIKLASNIEEQLIAKKNIRNREISSEIATDMVNDIFDKTIKSINIKLLQRKIRASKLNRKYAKNLPLLRENFKQEEEKQRQIEKEQQEQEDLEFEQEQQGIASNIIQKFFKEKIKKNILTSKQQIAAKIKAATEMGTEMTDKAIELEIKNQKFQDFLKAKEFRKAKEERQKVGKDLINKIKTATEMATEMTDKAIELEIAKQVKNEKAQKKLNKMYEKQMREQYKAQQELEKELEKLLKEKQQKLDEKQKVGKDLTDKIKVATKMATEMTDNLIELEVAREERISKRLAEKEAQRIALQQKQLAEMEAYKQQQAIIAAEKEENERENERQRNLKEKERKKLMYKYDKIMEADDFYEITTIVKLDKYIDDIDKDIANYIPTMSGSKEQEIYNASITKELNSKREIFDNFRTQLLQQQEQLLQQQIQQLQEEEIKLEQEKAAKILKGTFKGFIKRDYAIKQAKILKDLDDIKQKQAENDEKERQKDEDDKERRQKATEILKRVFKRKSQRQFDVEKYKKDLQDINLKTTEIANIDKTINDAKEIIKNNTTTLGGIFAALSSKAKAQRKKNIDEANAIIANREKIKEKLKNDIEYRKNKINEITFKSLLPDTDVAKKDLEEEYAIKLKNIYKDKRKNKELQQLRKDIISKINKIKEWIDRYNDPKYDTREILANIKKYVAEYLQFKDIFKFNIPEYADIIPDTIKYTDKILDDANTIISTIENKRITSKEERLLKKSTIDTNIKEQRGIKFNTKEYNDDVYWTQLQQNNDILLTYIKEYEKLKKIKPPSKSSFFGSMFETTDEKNEREFEFKITTTKDIIDKIKDTLNTINEIPLNNDKIRKFSNNRYVNYSKKLRNDALRSIDDNDKIKQELNNLILKKEQKKLDDERKQAELDLKRKQAKLKTDLQKEEKDEKARLEKDKKEQKRLLEQADYDIFIRENTFNNNKKDIDNNIKRIKELSYDKLLTEIDNSRKIINDETAANKERIIPEHIALIKKYIELHKDYIDKLKQRVANLGQLQTTEQKDFIIQKDRFKQNRLIIDDKIKTLDSESYNVLIKALADTSKNIDDITEFKRTATIPDFKEFIDMAISYYTRYYNKINEIVKVAKKEEKNVISDKELKEFEKFQIDYDDIKTTIDTNLKKLNTFSKTILERMLAFEQTNVTELKDKIKIIKNPQYIKLIQKLIDMREKYKDKIKVLLREDKELSLPMAKTSEPLLTKEDKEVIEYEKDKSEFNSKWKKSIFSKMQIIDKFDDSSLHNNKTKMKALIKETNNKIKTIKLPEYIDLQNQKILLYQEFIDVIDKRFKDLEEKEKDDEREAAKVLNEALKRQYADERKQEEDARQLQMGAKTSKTEAKTKTKTPEEIKDTKKMEEVKAQMLKLHEEREKIKEKLKTLKQPAAITKAENRIDELKKLIEELVFKLEELKTKLNIGKMEKGAKKSGKGLMMKSRPIVNEEQDKIISRLRLLKDLLKGENKNPNLITEFNKLYKKVYKKANGYQFLLSDIQKKKDEDEKERKKKDKKDETGNGIKPKSREVKTDKIEQDKDRLRLIEGEIKAGNTNTKLILELNKLYKKIYKINNAYATMVKQGYAPTPIKDARPETTVKREKSRFP